MAITSESHIIDVRTISDGCTIIEEAARDYTTCASKVNEAASICTDKALSVEKKSMQQPLQDLGTSVGTIESNIRMFTAQIRSVAMQIESKQRAELIAYQDAQRKAQEAANAANNTNTTNTTGSTS